MTDSSTPRSNSELMQTHAEKRENPNTQQAVALATATPEHINTLLTWFNHADEMFQWGGPGITFPTNNVQFLRDIGWLKLASFVLINESEQLLAAKEQSLLGFAQVYERLGRYHFGRVAISPHQRGQQLGQRFLQRLCDAITPNGSANSASFAKQILAAHPQGDVDLPNQMLALPFTATGFSLFVLSDNKPAIRCYEKLGFTVQPYPESIPGGLQNCLYMVKE